MRIQSVRAASARRRHVLLSLVLAAQGAMTSGAGPTLADVANKSIADPAQSEHSLPPPLVRVLDVLDEAAREHQQKIIAPLTAPKGRYLHAINEQTRAANRWILSWIALGRAAYDVYVAQNASEPLLKLAARELNAIEAARAFAAARRQAEEAWTTAENAAARASGADKATRPEKLADTAADLQRERTEKARDAIAKWREENDRKINEGLRKLEEFEKANKPSKATDTPHASEGEAKRSEAPAPQGEPSLFTTPATQPAPSRELSHKAEMAEAARTQKLASELRRTYVAEMTGFESARARAAENAAAAAREAERAERALAERREGERLAKDTAARKAAEREAEEKRSAYRREMAEHQAQQARAAEQAAVTVMAEDAAQNAEAAITAAKEKLATDPPLAPESMVEPVPPKAVIAAIAEKAVERRQETAEEAPQTVRTTKHAQKARRTTKPCHRHASCKQPRYYTVTRGDTLAGIAKRFLNDPEAYPRIMRMNRGRIRRSDLIYPGQRLKLPRPY